MTISESGNFDTSRRISFRTLEQRITKEKTILDEIPAFHEAIKGKIIRCNICFEAWLGKLNLVRKIWLAICAQGV